MLQKFNHKRGLTHVYSKRHEKKSSIESVKSKFTSNFLFSINDM